VVASVPAWPYSGRWGYTPTAVAVLVLLGFMALTYVGYIGPWEQEGPPFHIEEGAGPDAGPDPGVEADRSGEAETAGAD
jgi:hypothetical protein